MREENFVENINEKKMIEIIDRALRYEKNIENNKIKISWLKIIPAVAAVVFFIGLMNLNLIIPNSSRPGTGRNISGDYNYIEKVDLFVPNLFEKSFFENKILSVITNERAYNQITAYYTLQDLNLDENTINKRIIPVYMLDPNITYRETDVLLDYLNEYTDLTGNDIVQMYANYGIPFENYSDPNGLYANIRFGKTKNILLLEIEWFTYDEYVEFIEEFKNFIYPEMMKKDTYYMQLSDKAKEYYDYYLIPYAIMMEKAELDWQKNNKAYKPKIINGKYTYERDVKNIDFGVSDSGKKFDIKNFLTPEGYYPVHVYPYFLHIGYFDENDEWTTKEFGYAYSKTGFENILNSEIIPYCRELLVKGLITQEMYDYQMKDPLQRYADKFFN